MNLQKLFFIPILIYFNFFFSSIINVNAETTNQLNIETNPLPDSFLFDLTNMKPGDWVTRKLTIQNRGEQDFTFNTKVDFKGGSKELFNEFLLKISDSNGIIHEGKLKDFKGLEPRFLKSMNEEDLLFVAEFPYELGNEFQGLGFDVEFRFIVEDFNSPPPENPDGPDDPNDPENPDEPEDPQEPIEPDNPQNPNNNPLEPTNTTEPQNPDEINPQRPIDPEELNSEPVEGKILPSTSTNIFNYLIAGLLLISAGGFLFYIQRKRTKVITK